MHQPAFPKQEQQQAHGGCCVPKAHPCRTSVLACYEAAASTAAVAAPGSGVSHEVHDLCQFGFHMLTSPFCRKACVADSVMHACTVVVLACYCASILNHRSAVDRQVGLLSEVQLGVAFRTASCLTFSMLRVSLLHAAACSCCPAQWVACGVLS